MMMNKFHKNSVLMLLFAVSFIVTASTAYAQDQDNGSETPQEVAEEMQSEVEDESTSYLDLIGQAGGIQYPIYGILIIGIVLISLRSYELFMDQKQGKELHETSFQDLSLASIDAKISSQSEHMLSKVTAKLLNVFKTNKKADYLHDEISNYNEIQQENFNTFKNRIDFLSDTAGALGLLGTVWGMFFVFSSGTLEKENILAGMGFALMSTLLGLIVSIILNFCSTIAEGYFSKYLEKINSKADELRFRLIELAETPVPSIVKEVSNSKTSQHTNNNANNQPTKKEKQSTPPPKEKAVPKKLIVKSDLDNAIVGETISGVSVQLIDNNGQPMPSVKLEAACNKNGQINGNKKTSIKTDNKGVVNFDWFVGEETGTSEVQIRCADSPDINTKISIDVLSGEPDSLELINNHQATTIGELLKKPISIKVKDEYGNPIVGHDISMKVTMGNGTFENDESEISVKTNEDGEALANFKLGDEPGFNAIDITAENTELTKSFQAVGQEVLA